MPWKTIKLNNYLPCAVQLLLTDVQNYDSDVLLYFLHISACRFLWTVIKLKKNRWMTWEFVSSVSESVPHSADVFTSECFKIFACRIQALYFCPWQYCCDKHYCFYLYSLSSLAVALRNEAGYTDRNWTQSLTIRPHDMLTLPCWSPNKLTGHVWPAGLLQLNIRI